MTDQRVRPLSLARVRVRDCMHAGVMSCAPDDSFRTVAAIMANYRVHAVVVARRNGSRPLGIVSDLDMVSAAAAGETDGTVLQMAATEPLTISCDESLEHAAQAMSQHAVSHLVVVDRAGGYPLGMLSTLDIAAVCADG
jgi:CBS domain-containing protein